MYKHNWIQLKAEWLASDYPAVAYFFKAKHPEIAIGTYQKNIVGWVDEKHQLHEKVLARMVDKKASAIVRHSRLGRKIQAIAGRKLKPEAFEGAEGKDIVDAIKKGVEIESKAYGLDGVDVATQVNVQVNNGFTGISEESLVALGQAIARAKANADSKGDASLGS